jgi:hypothetical protein
MGLTERADGTQGFGGLIFDDPDKTLDVRGWMKVLILETACTSAPYIGSGYIGPRRITRSNGVATYKTGNGRFIDCDIVDENVLLDIRIITDSDGKRPAETHADRINWLLASKYLDQGTDLIDDTTLVDLSNPRPFEEADYRKQYPSNVLEDIDSALARTSFVYTVGTNGQRGLFFDFPDQAVGICTLSISNDLSDITFDANGEITGTVYPPEIDAVQTLDPSEVYAKVLYEYRHGTVTANNVTTHDTFFSDNSLGYRGVAVTNTRIGLESTARLFADNYLTAHSVEKETITVGVLLPKEKAGLIRAGQFINVKFGHFDNFSGSYKQMRITERVIAHADQTNEKYLLMLELSNRPVSVTGPSGGAPGPGDFPHDPPPCATATLVQWAEVSAAAGDQTITFGAALTPGNLVVAAVVFHDNQPGLNMPTMTGWTATPDGAISVPNADGSDNADGTMAMFYRTVVDGDGDSYTISNFSISTRIVLMEFSGSWTIGSSDNDGASGTSGNTAFPAPLGSVAVTAESLVVGIAIWSAPALGGTCTIDRGTVVTDGDPGLQGPPLGVSWEAVSTAQTVAPTMTLNVSFTATNGHAGMMQVFTCANTPADNPPSPAQPFGPVTPVETPDGATTTFTLPAGYEFADGSLRVYVDRLDQSAAITAYDGAARTFTLAFAPTTGELVEAYGMGR